MRPLTKIALVAGGYLAALLIAAAAVAIRIASTSTADEQASSGMYAFGDALVFTFVFGICSLVPTGAALIFLRPYRRVWTVLAVLALAVAVTGVTAAVLFAVGRHATASPLATLAAFSVLRILVAPLWAIVFLVFAILSPYRSPRVACLAATALEGVVSAYGGLVLIAPLFQDRV